MEATKIVMPSELFVPAESFSFSGEFDVSQIEHGPDTYRFAKPCRWMVQVTNTTGALLVLGTVEGIATTECSRCLEKFDLSLQGDVEGYVVLGEGHVEEDSEFEEYGHVEDDNVLDLEPMLRAALIMDFPLQPLCHEGCQGICPDCGANLNETTCDCASEREQSAVVEHKCANPFAALAQLSFDEEETE